MRELHQLILIEEPMRPEIEQQIKNSGTTDESLIVESYKKSLRSSGTPERAIEKLAQNKETIQTIKHRIALADMSIKDDEIDEIAQRIVNDKPHTRQISLTRNCITDQGAIKLAHLLQGLENLSFLDLQSNEIGEEGMAALFELAAQKPKLILALRGNQVSRVDVIDEIKRKAENRMQKNKI